MVSIPLTQQSEYSDTDSVALTGDQSAPAGAVFVVVVTPDVSGTHTFTIPDEITHLVVNGHASNTFDLATTGNAPITLGAGESATVAWNIASANHVVVQGQGTAGAPITFSQTALPASDSAAGWYSVQTGATRGLYIASGVGAPHKVVPYLVDGDWPVP